MTLRTVYIVRHGYRADWLPPPLPTWPTGIASDPPLAPHGVDQAKQLAEYIAHKSKPRPQVIFLSPFYRCVETATPTAEILGLPIYLERGLGEWYKPHKIVDIPPTIEQLRPYFSHLSDDWLWDTQIPSLKGETEEQIYARCKEFWRKFIPKFETKFPEVEAIMLVSHAATKIALGMALLDYKNVREFLRPEHGGDGKTLRIEAGTCSLDKFLMNKLHKWMIDYVAKTEFLKGGCEMNWHFATSKYVAGSEEDIKSRAQSDKV